MEVKPQRDYLVVRKRVLTVSPGGIYVGELVDDGLVKELVEGEIVAVGPGVKLTNERRDSMWDLKPGLVVKFSPVCSYPLTNDPGLLLIRRDAVAGVVV
jgi:co-chaperonin GroES (HSP10)